MRHYCTVLNSLLFIGLLLTIVVINSIPQIYYR